MELYKLSENAIQVLKYNKMLRARLSILYGVRSDITITNWIKTNAPQLHTVQAIALIKEESKLQEADIYAK